MRRVDAIVVGTGVMGAATAWSLARRGRSVVAIDRFAARHERGSSHGASRIFRLAYPERVWIDLARAAREDWRTLEAEAGERLVIETGSVDTGNPEWVEAIATALDGAGVRHDVLDPAAAQARWPGIAFTTPALVQPDGGRIEAAAAWRALVAQTERHGGEVHWESPAHAIEPSADGVRVVTDDETYDAGVAVVAAGAWMEPLLDPLLPLPRLAVTQESAFHFTPRTDGSWPSLIQYDAIPIYSLETPGEGVKVAEHHTGPVTTGDGRDFVVDSESRRRVTEFVATHLPGLAPGPVSETTCLYTSTASEDFVLDRVGPLVVVSPCSGHGFKFAPTIGRLAADLADGEKGLARFAIR